MSQVTYPYEQIRPTRYTFMKSTKEHTQLYTRILKTYYDRFSQEFALRALVDTAENNIEIPFDPTMKTAYLAFLIKRIL
jgi:hypothetical protein